MHQHYVLSINPQAQYDWERCVLRNPISGEQPQFAALVAQAVGNEPGAYLISINIDVQVLEKASVAPEEAQKGSRANKVNVPAQLHKLAAS